MSITKFLARDLTITINTGTLVSPIWTPIGGLNSLTHAASSTDAETTDFASRGRAEHIKAERSDTWTLAGFTLENVATGARDPGQLAVELLARTVGLASLGQFRIVSPGGTATRFMASAEVTLAGGANNDPASWQAVLSISGAITYA